MTSNRKRFSLRLTNRKRKSVDSDSDDNTPKHKRRKIEKKSEENISINIDETKLISYENIIKRELNKGESVMLQHLGKKRFIEVGIVYDGKAYSWVEGTFGSKGVKKTRNLSNKSDAYDAAVKKLKVKLIYFCFSLHCLEYIFD